MFNKNQDCHLKKWVIKVCYKKWKPCSLCSEFFMFLMVLNDYFSLLSVVLSYLYFILSVVFSVFIITELFLAFFVLVVFIVYKNFISNFMLSDNSNSSDFVISNSLANMKSFLGLGL